MATLGSNPEREQRAATRSCGSCSHCCTVLRVDELHKIAGEDCIHQRGGAGCGIYPTRPPICRGYRCLWLQGGLEDDERPDRTGGVVDLEPLAAGVQLTIREISRGRYDESPALQAIAERYRLHMPVRVTDAEDVMNPDRPLRVLMADGLEYRFAGEWFEIYRDGVYTGRRRLPWAERWARRLSNWWRRRQLASRRASAR